MQAGNRDAPRVRRLTGQLRAGPWATRVSESTSNNTEAPWQSRNHSAIAVAVCTARTRSSGEASDVAHTQLHAATSARRRHTVDEITDFPPALTDQTAHNDIGLSMLGDARASSVDLPTPAAANSPRRWPRPSVTVPSIARMPVANGSVIGVRDNALMARAEPLARLRQAAPDRHRLAAQHRRARGPTTRGQP